MGWLAGWLAAGLLLLFACPPDSRAAGEFAPVGPMLEARKDFGAAVLDDGRVLAAGGRGAGNALILQAEIYDPTSGFFTTTGSLAAGRDVNDVVKLNDGRVFVPGTAATPNEIFDPAAGAFVQTSPMLTPRAGASLVLLPDGRVLIAGGEAAGGVVLASAEIFDPSTGIYSATGSMTHARNKSRDATLLDGRVLIAGGLPEAGSTEISEIYNPGTGTFTTSGTLQAERNGAHNMVTLSDGQVMVAGGTAAIPEPKYELYSPFSGFFNGFYLRSSTSNPTLSALADGTVLSLGNSPEIVNPATQVASTFPGPVAWNGHQAVTLPDGRILVFGGFHPTEGSSVPSRAYVYYPNGLPRPTIAQTVTVKEVSGKTSFSCPRQGTFDPIPEVTQLRVGCEIDTRRGTVELLAASTGGNPALQRARFSKGVFRFTQTRKTGTTNLYLSGALKCRNGKGFRGLRGKTASRFRNSSSRDGRSFLGQREKAASGQMAAHISRRKRPPKFQSWGDSAAAGVRGTDWYVEDRCDKTTLVRVREGVVTVRDLVKKITIRLTAGKTYIAGKKRRR